MKAITRARQPLREGRLYLAVLILAGSAATTALATGNQTQASSPPEPVTLSVQNLDIQEVLSMLSQSRNLNIICQGNVEGLISTDLRDVPFHEALRAVVAMAGFEVVRKGSIYFVHEPSEPDAITRVMHEVRTFRLNYAEPDNIQSVLEQILSPIGRSMSYLPLRALVVEDRPEVLDRVEAVIQALDLPPRQVLIEAHILEARLSRDTRLGIDWSLVFSKGDGTGNINLEGFGTPGGVGSQGFFVTWGEGDFVASLESMEEIEELNTLAAPRLLTIDGAQAEIIIGGQLGFSVVTTVDNTVIQSVEFLDTGTQLRLTPTITGDGYVMMEVHPELSSGVIDAGLPSKTTAEVTTEVLIKDGHTLFIGGLIQERDELTRKGIPLLSRIPVLGALFGRTVNTVVRSELIALITPRIVQPGQAVPYDNTMVPPLRSQETREETEPASSIAVSTNAIARPWN
ncbi:MAG: hypothetical protein KAY24_11130 [Candidatus Eisenbacteria sp.]|nr:hypothetical protein [Candidatus Eisenbacteria bacterium]